MDIELVSAYTLVPLRKTDLNFRLERNYVQHNNS